jgi:hypothetical protein
VEARSCGTGLSAVCPVDSARCSLPDILAAYGQPGYGSSAAPVSIGCKMASGTTGVVFSVGQSLPWTHCRSATAGITALCDRSWCRKRTACRSSCGHCAIRSDGSHVVSPEVGERMRLWRLSRALADPAAAARGHRAAAQRAGEPGFRVSGCCGRCWRGRDRRGDAGGRDACGCRPGGLRAFLARITAVEPEPGVGHRVRAVYFGQLRVVGAGGGFLIAERTQAFHAVWRAPHKLRNKDPRHPLMAHGRSRDGARRPAPAQAVRC